LDIFDKIRLEISLDLEKIYNLILENIKVPENLVNEVTDYVLKRKGKKIRPIITLLISKMISGKVSDPSIFLACAVELIHIATLLHDDVIDLGKVRNGQISPNQIWDNKTTILAGDFLFSQAFKFMVKAKNLPALDLLSSSSSIIAEGEITQLRLQKEKRIITKEEYFNVIESKTAKLFSSAAACGSIASNGNHEITSKVENFGFLFGTIFQISDDILDYKGITEEIGKSIGSDFFENKVTLPVIITYSKCNPEDQQFWETRFFENDKSHKDFEYALHLIDKYDSINEISQTITNLKNQAITSIKDIGHNSLSKELLIELLDFCISRKK
jgi:octaprenyl-diphosphate synthase